MNEQLAYELVKVLKKTSFSPEDVRGTSSVIKTPSELRMS